MIWIILITIALTTLYAFTLGYREVQILCEQVKGDQTKTSWKFKDYKDWFWQTNQIDKSKSNWDSFHVSNGVTVALVSILIALVLFFALDLAWWWLLILPAPIWIYIMQIRNFTMHTVMKK